MLQKIKHTMKRSHCSTHAQLIFGPFHSIFRFSLFTVHSHALMTSSVLKVNFGELLEWD